LDDRNLIGFHVCIYVLKRVIFSFVKICSILYHAGCDADRCSSSEAKRKKEVGSDDVSPGAKRLRSSGLHLPEVWHIFPLMQ
jgi:hypothetical protein